MISIKDLFRNKLKMINRLSRVINWGLKYILTFEVKKDFKTCFWSLKGF